YTKFEWFAGSIIGRIILFGYTWSVIHHMLGGIRHLIWDTGRGFGPTEREWLAAATLIGSIAITVLLWIFGLLAMGGPLWATPRPSISAPRFPAYAGWVRPIRAPNISGASG